MIIDLLLKLLIMPIDLLLRSLGLHKIFLLPDRGKKSNNPVLSNLFIWQLWLTSRKQQMEQTEFSELFPMEAPAQPQLRQCGLNTQLSAPAAGKAQPGTCMEIIAITGCLADVFNCLGCWPTTVAEGSVSLKAKTQNMRGVCPVTHLPTVNFHH